MWINQYLRGEEGFGELTQEERQLLRDLDTATDGQLPDQTLYRSVDASAIFKGASETEIANTLQALRYGENSFGRGAYADSLREQTSRTLNNVIGKVQTEYGFMSTTSEKGIAADFGSFTGAENPVVMRIDTKGIARGVNLSRYDANVSPDMAQKERLLARGTSYKVNGISVDRDKNIIIDVELRGG